MNTQPDLFGGADDDSKASHPPARRSITVPAAGLSDKALPELLGCTTAEINSHCGSDLGAPRDYRWVSTGYVFNIEGVRRLVALLHLEDVDVLAEGEPQPAPVAGPRRRQRGPWWLADQSEGDK